jgi:hypothetical protein
MLDHLLCDPGKEPALLRLAGHAFAEFREPSSQCRFVPACHSRGAIIALRLCERSQDLLVLREPVLALFREHDFSVDEHVELAPFAFGDLRPVLGVRVDLGRETRGPAVIARSDGAVVDLDSCHQIVLNCSKGCLHEVQ